MINTYRYAGRAEVEQDGERTTVQVPPPVILTQIGPFIQPVTITHPPVMQEDLEKQGKTVPTVSIKALIDTGAHSSVITPQVAEDLELVHTGYRTVISVQNEQPQPVYYAYTQFPWGMGKEIPVVACPLRHFDCLIGRDILMHWHFTYNGPDGSTVICD